MHAERMREHVLPVSTGSNRSSVSDSDLIRSTAKVRRLQYSGTNAIRYSAPCAKTTRVGSMVYSFSRSLENEW